MSNESTLPADSQRGYEKLRGLIRGYGSVVVAYSGGVDSGLLAYVAHAVLGPRALPVLGVSPSLASRERNAAIGFLERHGIPFETIETHEMDRVEYTRNDADRCYHCKHELFGRLAAISKRRGFACVGYGANADDGADYRPGARAAQAHRVVAPLAESGLGKRQVRTIARHLGLELWDKPAAPCLASRLPYFEAVTPGRLARVEAAEDVLKDLGFGICRVRHHGDVARIELPRDAHVRFLEDGVREAVLGAFKRIGFRYVTLDVEGFRSGGLNDALEGRVPGVLGGHPAEDG